MIDRLAQKFHRRARVTPDLYYVLTLLIVIIIVGTAGFFWLESWSLLDALYTTVITITTVGYGDFSPATSEGRLFAVFFVAAAVGLAGYAVSSVAAITIKREQRRVEYRRLERKMRKIEDLNNHIILCGGGTTSSQIAREFLKAKTPFIIIEPEESRLRLTLLYMRDDVLAKKVQQLKKPGDFLGFEDEAEQDSLPALAGDLGVIYLQEDPREDTALYRAGIARAKGLVSVMDEDQDNLFVVLSARQLATQLENSKMIIVSQLNQERNFSKLRAAGADRIVTIDIVAGIQLATSILSPEIAKFWAQTYLGESSVRFVELSVHDRPDLVGQNLLSIRSQHNILVVAIQRGGEYVNLPPLNTSLEPDDRIIGITQR